MAQPLIHHRTDRFKALLKQTHRNLQEIFRSENDVAILTSSGTGAMEAVVSALLGQEDHALAVVAGKFGQRWLEICQTHKIPCTPLYLKYGRAATDQDICQALQENADTSVLLIQGCETSTATSHNLERISKSVHENFPEVLIVVDAITALLTEKVETDLWNLDVVIGGAQKAFGMPPGLAFLSVSSRAIEKIQSTSSRSYYLNLHQEILKQRDGQSNFTPAISLIQGLHKVTGEILRQGPENIIAEAALMARCTRKGLKSLGFQLVSHAPSNAVTAAFPPSNIKAPDLVKKLEAETGIKVAGGQDELKNKIIRIAHLGYFDLIDVFSVLSAIELCLLMLGTKVELGKGVGAALHEASETVC